MSTFNYLTSVVAVLAAAFFLSHHDENKNFLANSYDEIIPAAISGLPLSLPKS